MSPLLHAALPYWLRLLGVCLGAGGLTYVAASAVSSLLGPWVASALRRSELETRRPGLAAGWMLLLRLLPAVAALAAVAALCLPSYLLLEPHEAGEQVGWSFYLTAALGLWLLGWGLLRLARALATSRRFERGCRAAGEDWRQAAALGWDGAAMTVDATGPAMAVSGVMRPTLLISRRLVEALPTDQLVAGLRHERAHLKARDNLKRLAIAATPALLGRRGQQRLEESWARLAEWSADDRAVAGAGGRADPVRSVALAAALVSAARLGLSSCPVGAISSLAAIGGASALAERVRRLLAPPGAAGHTPAAWRRWAPWAAVPLCLALLAAPATLHLVHGLLEVLVH